MVRFLGDLTSYDFVNNVDDVFEREVLGAAYVTYAANQTINVGLKVFIHDQAVLALAWVGIFLASLYVFAFWSRIVG